MKARALLLPLVLILSSCAGTGFQLFGLDTTAAVATSTKRQQLHEKLGASWVSFLNNPKVQIAKEVRDAYLKAIAGNLEQYDELAAADLGWLDEVATGILSGSGIDWRKAWDALRNKLKE